MKVVASLGSLVVALVLCAGCGATPSRRALPLFDAMPYAEWRVVGGTARFEVLSLPPEDRGAGPTLVGQGPIPRNGFLASPRELHDFRLAVEVRLGSADSPRGEGMNSGIQIRSREQDGTIAGLQIEVDPTERRWSGGVYDERGRGWLAPLKDDPAAMAAFRPGEWNLYEIECIGPRVRTRVNGVACAEWHDGIVSGMLAFQVHGGKACEVAFRAPRLEELGAHAWESRGGEARGKPGEICGWSCAVPRDARGVRIDALVGDSTVELRAECGALLAAIDVPARARADDPDANPLNPAPPALPRVVELLWIDGRGAALVDGARAAALSLERPVARVFVRGASASVGGHAVLRAMRGTAVDERCGVAAAR